MRPATGDLWRSHTIGANTFVFVLDASSGLALYTYEDGTFTLAHSYLWSNAEDHCWHQELYELLTRCDG
jgi:hypothetical protein